MTWYKPTSVWTEIGILNFSCTKVTCDADTYECSVAPVSVPTCDLSLEQLDCHMALTAGLCRGVILVCSN